MPPKKQLSAEQIADLTQVDRGRRRLAQGRSCPPISASPTAEYEQLRKEHWAWQPLAEPNAARRCKTPPGPRDDIDRFVLAKLEERRAAAGRRRRPARR